MGNAHAGPAEKTKGLQAGNRVDGYNVKRNSKSIANDGGTHMSDKSDLGNQVGTAVTFLLIGVGAGALLALLYAPKSGEQLRRDLRRKYKDARDAVEDFAEEAKGSVEEALERGADWVEDVEKSARKRVAPLKRALQRD